ncbi:tRNA (adenosine(37)-N6)-threonylcarbamoyltransferase complex ATPase subunit type 1 TsaE [Sulfitobacter albidus]|uniref:tRNA threonylcarbamoyladenosine biosynthesis protein TsaE n=1 Tax=Sulfitobacter albidus TaxID=2829501 RepID=A0A975JCZ0_9RHOB|nr:tRNA (adenosine(37)-N6)-threonylcarbamoyltransferase complex ATPase subunit type 1 TsaE [Sulfitobacter albidus]QUJ76163.1 tRNA (adenosine(37)-N6)-threonylcarbamoyltransferase complex ATPase subunit type 1 TsaE [Sulfitobacter albidus]
MPTQKHHFSSPDETAAFARRIGARLTAGDTLLLTGDVGAGKTHFARSLIQSLLETPEDVPSPTFTLVQTYDSPVAEIWHADLYRLSDPSEIEELGLRDAFDTAICLVEWPDRLGDLRPANALDITLSPGDGETDRHMTIAWDTGLWEQKLCDGMP